MPIQNQRVFFGSHDPWEAVEPTVSERQMMVSRDNPNSPFSRFIGNDKAVRKLQTAAFNALGHPNHLMRELSFSIFGPSSAGKTTLARLYAEVVDLPFIEVSPKSIRTIEDLFKKISDVLGNEGVPLVEVRPKHYVLPPCVILIDEVHALSDSVVQGLLKATEYNDSVMATETGKVVNTYDVTWFVATTDEGKLFDAFRTRFSPVMLKMLNKDEVSQVVRLANPDLSSSVCSLIAHYNSRIPRKALEFARYMRMAREMHPDLSWSDLARRVASDEGIDEHGMHEVHLGLLRALSNGPIAKNRIGLITGRKDEEVDRYILPWLLTETDDMPALVTVTAKGYTITTAGILELERRDIVAISA